MTWIFKHREDWADQFWRLGRESFDDETEDEDQSDDEEQKDEHQRDNEEVQDDYEYQRDDD